MIGATRASKRKPQDAKRRAMAQSAGLGVRGPRHEARSTKLGARSAEPRTQSEGREPSPSAGRWTQAGAGYATPQTPPLDTTPGGAADLAWREGATRGP